MNLVSPLRDRLGLAATTGDGGVYWSATPGRARRLTGSCAGAYDTGTSITVDANDRGQDEAMRQLGIESIVFKGRAVAPSGAWMGRMSVSGVRREC